MIDADVQLTEALAVLVSQAGDMKLGQILQNIRDQVLAGESFAESLKQYPGWFDTIYISMVRVGEVTGNLGRSLVLLAEYIGKKQRLESKVKSALTYPALLVVICVFVTTFLMTFVVPKMIGIIEESGREVPLSTAALMKISWFLTNYWPAVLVAVAAVVWLLRRAIATTKGRMTFDRLILKVPVIGELIRQSIVVRFTSTLAALIRSGLPMADSLQVVAEVTGNSVMERAVRVARERIIAGADVATPLRESKVVDPAVAHMVAVGERTGELESMLIKIAEAIEEATDITVARISSAIEPLMIVVLAVIVGFILYAVLVPMLQVANIGTV